ncbi:MAG: hypothetical protein ACE5JG_13145, partial [Planctomycetota bacterium]
VVRVDLARSDRYARASPARAAAEIRLEFADGPDLRATAPRSRSSITILQVPEGRLGAAVRGLSVRSLPPHGRLVLDACYAGPRSGPLTPWPLAVVSASGVPLDIWRGRPRTHVVQIPRGRAVQLPPVGRPADRLWLAFAAEGAFPFTPYEAEVARVRVHYADGPPVLETPVLNGRDTRDHALVSYSPSTRRDTDIALEWETPGRLPAHYTLFGVPLDPRRTVDRIELEDRGVLRSLRLAAATLGRREFAAPAPASGLTLSGDLLAVRPDVFERWRGLGLTLRAGGVAVGHTGPRRGTSLTIPLPPGPAGETALEVRLPRSAWARTLSGLQPYLLATAALLGCLAAILFGARFVRRARRVRVKMRAALGVATLIPFAFLFYGLTTLLTGRAETDLRETTLAELRAVRERLLASPSRARALAARARDLLNLPASSDSATLGRLAATLRADLRRADGAFLLLPDAETTAPSPVGNLDFFDSLLRAGLYFSPWDAVVAVGIARGPQGRCLVGIPAGALIGGRAQPESRIVLFGPDGR